jgi:hypothetical protein
VKLTRRELVVAAGSVAAAKALAQAPAAPPQPPGPRDFAQEARDNLQRNGATLAKFVIPMAVEPAFQFKA